MSPAVSRPRYRSGATFRAGILLVDDRPANLLALEAILEPLDLDLVRANSGEEALKHLLRREFALVLLDVQMPGMDGFETAAAIRAHPRTAELPIIFITAISRDAANIFTGYANGAVDYLLKPFDPEILRAKVSVFVELYCKSETIKAQAKVLHERELEAVARRGEDRLHLLTESMPVAMWGLRKAGEVYYVNRAWKEYAGRDAAQTACLDNPAFVHPEDVDGVHASWMDALVARQAFEREYRLRRGSDGEYRWHLVRAVPERKDGGALEGWIATAIDVHEQKLARETQARLLEQEYQARHSAEAANRMKDEFLANVSHELRTPLHAILGWTRMLRSGTLEAPRAAHALEAIDRSAHAQTNLIEDLLDVSRIISGKLRIKTVPVRLGSAVQAAVETVRPAADIKGVELACTIPPDVGSIVGDPDRIQQVVWNLVSNAVKFTDKGGRVVVRVVPGDGTISIVVSDSGAGIAPEFLPYAFDRFRQADNSSTRSHQGLGLGLAIVRHLAELHGGSAHAASAGLGSGATFTVTLPTNLAMDPALAPDSVPPTLPGTEPSSAVVSVAPARVDGIRVLVVDDQEDARELLAEVLESAGAAVVVAESAATALEALRTSVPDVIVSDIGLPGEDGFALIRQVRVLAPALPAIAVSGYARQEDRDRAVAEGFQVHLTKPVDLDEVVAVIAKLAAAASAASSRALVALKER